VIDICRSVWRRDRLEYDGEVFQIPLPEGSGSGLGKPLKLISHPVRERIPILVAAIGPKNVELAAEVAEAWEPIFFYPERAQDVWGSSLATGAARRDPTLGPLEVFVSVSVAVGDDTDGLLDSVRPMLSLYLGGMGARGKNFYNNLACRYGFEAEAAQIQDLYLAGKKVEAEAAVPEELIRATNLIGPEGYVAERLAAFREAGVTGILLQSVDNTSTGRRAALDAVQRLQA
jgi:F420-dependent oxidoreductase-like protein